MMTRYCCASSWRAWVVAACRWLVARRRLYLLMVQLLRSVWPQLAVADSKAR